MERLPAELHDAIFEELDLDEDISVKDWALLCLCSKTWQTYAVRWLYRTIEQLYKPALARTLEARPEYSQHVRSAVWDIALLQHKESSEASLRLCQTLHLKQSIALLSRFSHLEDLTIVCHTFIGASASNIDTDRIFGMPTNDDLALFTPAHLRTLSISYGANVSDEDVPLKTCSWFLQHGQVSMVNITPSFTKTNGDFFTFDMHTRSIWSSVTILDIALVSNRSCSPDLGQFIAGLVNLDTLSIGYFDPPVRGEIFWSLAFPSPLPKLDTLKLHGMLSTDLNAPALGTYFPSLRHLEYTFFAPENDHQPQLYFRLTLPIFASGKPCPKLETLAITRRRDTLQFTAYNSQAASTIAFDLLTPFLNRSIFPSLKTLALSDAICQHRQIINMPVLGSEVFKEQAQAVGVEFRVDLDGWRWADRQRSKFKESTPSSVAFVQELTATCRNGKLRM